LNPYCAAEINMTGCLEARGLKPAK